MLSLQREPECVPEDNDVEVRLYMEGLAGQSVIALGVRTALGQNVFRGAPVSTGPYAAIKLSWYLFEVERELELGVKEGGYATPEPPDWEQMDWSWQQWYKAQLVDGKPSLVQISR